MRPKSTLAILALASAGVTATVLAFNPQPEPPKFSMLGVVRTQTAMLNVVLTQPPDPQLPPCVVDLSFVDSLGQIFHDAAGNEISKKVSLRDNVAGSLSMPAGVVLPPRQNRIPIRAVVDHPQSLECDGLKASLEIVDATSGKTVLLYAGQPPDPAAPSCPQLQPVDRP